MKMIKIISSLFLLSALCGCTTQSVDNAREIEERNSYVYKYEYETNEEGQVETKINVEKPSVDMNDFDSIKGETVRALENKNGNLKFIKMNETYTSGGLECTFKQAYLTTKIDYVDSILDKNELQVCKTQLMKMFPSGSTDSNKNEKILWVKVHVKNVSDKDIQANMRTNGAKEVSPGNIRPAGVNMLLLDKDEYFKDKEAKRETVIVKSNSEMDVWFAFICMNDNSSKYYIFGDFGYIYDPSDYSGIMVELNNIKEVN